MKLTLKIALGVFVGSIAAYVALNLPGWMRQAREENARHEAAVREAENRPKILHFWTLLQTMTPDMVISRCGKPYSDTNDASWKDNPIPASKRDEDRILFFSQAEPGLTLEFTKFGGNPWKFSEAVSTMRTLEGKDMRITGATLDNDELHALKGLGDLTCFDTGK